jgi:hypothetical protein
MPGDIIVFPLVLLYLIARMFFSPQILAITECNRLLQVLNRAKLVYKNEFTVFS